MQVTLNIDESLLTEALQLTEFTTQEELVNLALQELIHSRRNKDLLDDDDSEEETVEIQAARQEYRDGEYITFDRYTTQRENRSV